MPPIAATQATACVDRSAAFTASEPMGGPGPVYSTSSDVAARPDEADFHPLRSPKERGAVIVEALMTNVPVILWLLTGGMLGCLTALQRHFSMTALAASLVFAMALLAIFGLIRRQPTR
jgi:hypothetical protein